MVIWSFTKNGFTCDQTHLSNLVTDTINSRQNVKMLLMVVCFCIGAILLICYQITLKAISNLEHRVFADMIREMEVYEEEDVVYPEMGDGDLPPDQEIPHVRIVDCAKKKRSRITRWQQKFYLKNPQSARRTRSCEDFTKNLFNINPIRRRMSELY